MSSNLKGSSVSRVRGIDYKVRYQTSWPLRIGVGLLAVASSFYTLIPILKNFEKNHKEYLEKKKSLLKSKDTAKCEDSQVPVTKPDETNSTS